MGASSYSHRLAVRCFAPLGLIAVLPVVVAVAQPALESATASEASPDLAERDRLSAKIREFIAAGKLDEAVEVARQMAAEEI